MISFLRALWQSQNNYVRMEAVHRAQAIIEFSNDGIIRWANQNFLAATGYRLDEIQGRHHRMFCDPAYAASQEYREFWASLGSGCFHDAEYQRFGKGGKEIWIKASYCPVVNLFGIQTGVVKFAVDITATRLLSNSSASAAKRISASAQNLGAVSQQLNDNAAQTAAKADQALETSHGVQSSTETVSRSTEQMLVAIQEISRSSAESSRMTTQAVVSANEGNERMQRLNESYAAIGKVVDLISSIAQQTNLLALNATIEASRAGDAGKGFAVVADEVKQLAKRTDEATRDIAARIQRLQGDTAAATDAIAGVADIIQQVNAISGTIAAAVEEQTVTTNEIGASIRHAADGTAIIAQSMTELAEAARSTATGASETRKAAATLSELASDLDRVAAV